MKVNIHDSDALQDLSNKICTAVPVLKKCSTGLIDPSTVLKPEYDFHKLLQGNGLFQKCEVRQQNVIDTSIFSIGTPVASNTVVLDHEGSIQHISFKKKCTEIDVYAMKWGYPEIMYSVQIPKYNYHSFEEQCFQLSCTDPNYAIIQFYMELQMAFNSNVNINLLAMDFDAVFKDL